MPVCVGPGGVGEALVEVDDVEVEVEVEARSVKIHHRGHATADVHWCPGRIFTFYRGIGTVANICINS